MQVIKEHLLWENIQRLSVEEYIWKFNLVPKCMRSAHGNEFIGSECIYRNMHSVWSSQVVWTEFALDEMYIFKYANKTILLDKYD